MARSKPHRSRSQLPALPPPVVTGAPVIACRACGAHGWALCQTCARRIEEEPITATALEVVPTCSQCQAPLYKLGYRWIWEIRRSPLCTTCAQPQGPLPGMSLEEQEGMAREIGEEVERLKRLV